MLLCDSLSRLAVAGKGVDDVKRLFGSGRALAEDDAGTLTVVATTLGDEGDAFEAVTTTETSLITLDPDARGRGNLAGSGLRRVPGRRRRQDPLRGGDGAAFATCASNLSELVPPEAAGFIRKQLESASSNADVLEEPGLAAKGVSEASP